MPEMGRSNALKSGAILQTNFVYKCRQCVPFCRQRLSENADKFCRQTSSRHSPPKCRQTSSKMQTRALGVWANCRRIMQTKVVCESGGDACILVRLHNVAGVVYSEMQTRVVYSEMQTRFVYSYSTFVSSGGSCNLFTVSSTSSA